MATDENVLSRVGISPQARSRWLDALEQFSSQNSDPKYRDSDSYPSEQATVDSDGLLQLRITFEDGGELAMKFSASEWCWVKQSSTGEHHGVQ